MEVGIDLFQGRGYRSVSDLSSDSFRYDSLGIDATNLSCS